MSCRSGEMDLTAVFFLPGFSESGDLSCTIMQIWARIEVRKHYTVASVHPSLTNVVLLITVCAVIRALLISDRPEQALHCKNMQKARELWDSIMTKGNAKYANMWLEYYNLERWVIAIISKMVKVNRVFVLLWRFWPLCVRSYGDAAHCRKALHRAVQCTSDYPEHVCEVLLTFERVEGELNLWRLRLVVLLLMWVLNWCRSLQVLWKTGMLRCRRRRPNSTE